MRGRSGGAFLLGYLSGGSVGGGSGISVGNVAVSTKNAASVH